MKPELILGENGWRIPLDELPYRDAGLLLFGTGNSGSGKSNGLGLLAEEFYRIGIPWIFYDINGDANSLKQLGHDVKVIGDPQHPDLDRRADYPLKDAIKDPDKFIRMMLEQDYSIVVDLTNPNDYEEDDLRHPYHAFIKLMKAHYRISDRLRRQVGVFVDEAHRFAPQTGATKLEKLTRRILTVVATDGRKRGMALVIFTQRATNINKNLVFNANVRLFGKITHPPDYEAIKKYIPLSFTQTRQLGRGRWLAIAENTGFKEVGMGVVQFRKKKTKDLGKTPAFVARKREAPQPAQLALFQEATVDGNG
ncbi:MAG: hypothetical protein FOGNACKC_00950 [Anaerolineae bacterium]|nr:hypothetical protein [Anaerolineae bacterium]